VLLRRRGISGTYGFRPIGRHGKALFGTDFNAESAGNAGKSVYAPELFYALDTDGGCGAALRASSAENARGVVDDDPAAAAVKILADYVRVTTGRRSHEEIAQGDFRHWKKGHGLPLGTGDARIDGEDDGRYIA
jgi:hypothetical protein